MARAVRSAIGLVLATAAIFCGLPAGGVTSVLLAVHFKVTNLDYRPLPALPCRITFGSDPDWQKANAGESFVTDANGEHRFTARVTLDKRLHKVPTNFIASLLSLPRVTDHLAVATELEYMTYRWVYVIDLFHFPGSGDTLLDGFSVYTPDQQGNFTNRAKQEGTDWRMRELGALALTEPGHAPWNFMLRPDSSEANGTRWTLDVAFKKSAPPIRR